MDNTKITNVETKLRRTEDDEWTEEELSRLSLGEDILSSFIVGRSPDGDWGGHAFQYCRFLMKDEITTNPVQAMLFYAMHMAYTQGMVQNFEMRHQNYSQTDNPDLVGPTATEYFRVLGELAKVYGQLFPEKVKLMLSMTDTVNVKDR